MEELEDFVEVGPRSYTVTEITEAIKDVLSIEFANVIVVGEISGYKVSQAGHVYLTLKDERAVLSAVIWRSTAARLRAALQDGLEVEARGRIDVYPPRGSYQLIVQSIRPVGEGELQRRFEELKSKLLAEGLFDEGRKRHLPTAPERVAVVTSPTGAAIRDFLKIVRRGFPCLEVSLFPVHVQGSEASGEIAHAIQILNRLGGYDLIVVTRGGGSLEDLWAFNEEKVARAIFASRIPVLSAVGHEVDFTISDFVADVRAPTPTGAALLLVQQREALLGEIRTLKLKLGRSAARFLSETRMCIQASRKALVRASPTRQVEFYRQRIDELSLQLYHRLCVSFERRRSEVSRCRERFLVRARRRLELLRGRLQALEGRLAALSPGVTFRRGFAHVTHLRTRKTVYSPAEVAAGDPLRIRVARGEFDAEVKPERSGE